MLNWWTRLRAGFALDIRSLALARIWLGLFVVGDLLIRLGDVEMHYSDLGLLPRKEFLSGLAHYWSISLHLANGTAAFLVVIFAIHIFCALAMSLGWHTRLTSGLTAILTISLHNRNWFVNNGGDDLLRVLLIIGAFLPWGEIWSVDQWRRGDGDKKPAQVGGTWVASWYLVTFCVYFVSYILKNHPIWREEYSALYYALHLDIFATSLGRWVRDFPGLLMVGTVITVFLEWGGPLLLLVSGFFQGRWRVILRSLVVLGFWGLHVGILLTMRIGFFPLYCIAMWAVFVPGEVWDWLQRQIPGLVSGLRAFMARLAGPPTQVQRLEPTRAARWSQEILGAFVFLIILFWNLSTLKPPLKVTSAFWQSAGRWTHLYQEWNMFAPFPKRENVWLEVPAVLEDGQSIELITGENDSLGGKELKFPGKIPNEHWRKYYLNLMTNPRLPILYAEALCRTWNRPIALGGREPRLKRLSVDLYQQVILPDYQRSPTEKRTLIEHWCFQAPPL